EASRMAPKWQEGAGPLRIGPFGISGLARIYYAILLTAFVAGVILSVVSHVTQGLGFALVVGSLFGYGAWTAQAWNLGVTESFRIRNELVGEFQLPLVRPSQLTAAHLARELNLNQPDARYYAAQLKAITNRIKEMGRDGRLDSNG